MINAVWVAPEWMRTLAHFDRGVNEACGDISVRGGIGASPCDAPLGSSSKTASAPGMLPSEILRVRVSYLPTKGRLADDTAFKGSTGTKKVLH